MIWFVLSCFIEDGRVGFATEVVSVSSLFMLFIMSVKLSFCFLKFVKLIGKRDAHLELPCMFWWQTHTHRLSQKSWWCNSRGDRYDLEGELDRRFNTCLVLSLLCENGVMRCNSRGDHYDLDGELDRRFNTCVVLSLLCENEVVQVCHRASLPLWQRPKQQVLDTTQMARQVGKNIILHEKYIWVGSRSDALWRKH